ncbi:MAG: aldo/keto reductase, partial [Draconibacterium sp.]|nr:aldo/keto reductase [Draconibacterium sp.]
FVNLHYYYFDQRNHAAVSMAEINDMGVFIISPNDKGGQLFNAPQKVKDTTLPLTPIQWNARFCMQNPAIHTLSFGITEKDHFKEMQGIFPYKLPWSEMEQKIKLELDKYILDDPYASYSGFDMQNDPSGINIPAVLRLRKLWKCYDMKGYGKYRYNLFQQKDHWFPGLLATNENIKNIDFSKAPKNLPLKEMLEETHKALFNYDIKIIKQ